MLESLPEPLKEPLLEPWHEPCCPAFQNHGAKFQACTRIPRMQVSKLLGFVQDYRIPDFKVSGFQGYGIPGSIAPGFSGFYGSRI